MKSTRTLPLLLVVLAFVACGDDPAPEVVVPSWAQVAPEQIAEAKRHGVPVAFENDLGMRFVLIPAGTFWMGSPEDEEGRKDDETWHEVRISRPYYVQITEVTNGQYRRFRPQHISWAWDQYSANGLDQPVLVTTWEEVSAFLAWAADGSTADGSTDRTCRLPTEAEWERACRAGTVTRYSWGDAEADGWKYANATDAVTKENFRFGWPGWPQDDGHRLTAPVGRYPSNGWGLYDMHGNACEWCADWYGPYPAEPVVDPQGPSGGSGRTLRGGSWAMQPSAVRSAWRGRSRPGENMGFGFRLVSPLPEPGD